MGIKLRRLGKASLFKYQRPDMELSIGTGMFAMIEGESNTASFCSLEIKGAHFSPSASNLLPMAWSPAQSE